MAAAAMKVMGLRKLAADFKRIGDGAPAALTLANKSMAQAVVELARPNIPSRSGKLRSGTVTRGLGSIKGAVAKSGNASAPYAAAIHYGTGRRPGLRGPHNIKGRPYLLDASKIVEETAGDRYLRELDLLFEGFER